MRDVQLVTPSTAPRGDGWSIVSVDLSMAADSDHSSDSVWLAYSSGGSKPAVTDLKCVLGAAVSSFSSDEGWEEIGVLPARAEFPERSILVRRGEGAPLTSIQAFRSPSPKPRYGYSALLDFSGGVLPEVGTQPSLTDPFEIPPIFHRYRIKHADHITYEESSMRRVSGFLVAMIYGHDLNRNVFDSRGIRRNDAGRLKQGGSL